MKAVDPETHYPIVSLHRQMFLWSVLLFVSVAAMFWLDYDREWKHWQRDFLDREHARTAGQLAATEKSVDPEMEAKESELARAEEKLKGSQDEIDKFQKEIDGQAALSYRVNLQFLDADQQVKSAKFFLDDAIHNGEDGEKEREKLQYWTDYQAARKVEVEKAEAAKKAAQDKVDAIEKDVLPLREKISDLHLQIQKIEKRLRDTDNTYWANRVRRMPFVEMLNTDIKIRQVQIDSLTDDYYFAKPAHVDRCMTCHMAIDKPEGYGKERNPLKSHPRLDLYVAASSKHPMEKFGCTSCHSGSGRSCTFTTSNHAPAAFEKDREETAARWKADYHWAVMERWDDPQLPKDLLTSACWKCHRQEIELEGAGPWNEGRKVFERAGCFACHRTAGFETMRRPGPNLYHISDKVTPEYAYHWILNPKQIRPETRMPRFFGHAPGQKGQVDDRDKAEVQALVAYLFAASEPLGDAAPTIPQEKGDAKRGEALTETIGCKACHAFHRRPEKAFVYNPDLMPPDLRKELFKQQDEMAGLTFQTAFGPVLAGVGSKVTYKWAWNWLKDPKHYFPETRMPNLRLTDPEAADVAAYLMTLKDDKNDLSKPAEETREIHNAAWEYLRAKHSLAEVGERDKAPTASYADTLAQDFWSNQVLAATGAADVELAGAVTGPAIDKMHGRLSLMSAAGVWKEGGAKFDEVVTGPLAGDLKDDLTMRRLEPALTRAKAILTEWSRRLVEATEVGQREKLYLGDKMVNRYGCFSCHAIRGYELTTPIGRDFTGQDGIGSKDLVQIDFGYTLYEGNNPHIDRDRWQWMDLKIKDPRIFDQGHDRHGDERLRMPLFNLSDEERHHLVVFLASLVKTSIPMQMQKNLDPTELALERGRQIVRDKNCAACHRFTLDRMAVKTGEGKQVVLEGLNNGVNTDDGSISFEVWRPNAEFGYKPGSKHTVDPGHWHEDMPGFGGDIVEMLLPGQMKKDGVSNPVQERPVVRDLSPPILVGEGKKVRPEWLFAFLKGPVPLRGFLQIRMPTFGLTDEEATDITRWFSLRDGERWPYESVPPPPKADAPEVLAGKKIFEAVACMSCHVVTGQKGSGGTLKAPDLFLAKERLKPSWIRSWLDDPGAIRPGTQMPPFHWGNLGKEFPGDHDTQIESMVDYLRTLTPAK